ncbi:hypothetical protein Tco_1558257, partial [Tanacetum coccineum]
HEEKLRADDERMAKEKESVVRVSLENEISSLKSDVLSLSQKGSSVPESLLKVETEKNESKKDLQKEKAKADSKKKRADEVLKTTKTERAELEVLKAVKIN